MKTILIYIALLGSALSLTAQSAAQLEQQALQTYDEAYLKDSPAEQAEAFEAAADLFDRAAEAYTDQGNTEKEKAMRSMAGLARQNAATRRRMAQYTTLGDITGGDFKISADTPREPRFLIEGGGTWLPAPRLSDSFYGEGMTEEILLRVYSDPEVFEPIFQSLGEFFIGDFSAPGTIENQAIHADICWQGAIDIWLTQNLYGGLDLQKRSFEATADFPVTGINITDGSTSQSRGLVGTEVDQTIMGVHLKYIYGHKKIRPFFSGGYSLTREKAGPTTISMGGVDFYLDDSTPRTKMLSGLQFTLGLMLIEKRFLAIQALVQRTFFLGQEPAVDGRYGLGLGVQIRL